MRGIIDWIFFKPRIADFEESDNEWWASLNAFVKTGHTTAGPFIHTFVPNHAEPNPYKNGPPRILTTNSTNLTVPITPTRTGSCVRMVIKTVQKPP